MQHAHGIIPYLFVNLLQLKISKIEGVCPCACEYVGFKTGRERERQRERETETDRERQRQTDRERERDSNKHQRRCSRLAKS